MESGGSSREVSVMEMEREPLDNFRRKTNSKCFQGSCMTNRNPIRKEAVDLTVKNSEKRLKKQKLRNNEYYDMQSTYDELYRKALNGKAFNDLMEIITCENNILLAYRNIKTNDGSTTAGTDGKTIKHYEEWSEEKFVKRFQAKLQNYIPKSVRRVEIPKEHKPGETRPLGIPCMDDRIIQQCIKQVLEPICEAQFHTHSYGFRPNRATTHAMARVDFLLYKGYHYVVDIDIKGFFDNVNHGKLLKQMWTLGIQDKNLICVIGKILKSEIEGIGKPDKGTPQGGIISPLLSNIVLNELDWWLSDQWETIPTVHPYTLQGNKQRILKKSNLKEFFFVRYADDFKILCKDYNTAQKIFIATKTWLKERLGLEISPEKSKITNVRKGKTEFLGLTLYCKKKKGKYIVRSNIADKAKQAIVKKYKEQIKRIQRNTNMQQVNLLNSKILGWHEYYSMATLCSRDFGEIAYSVSKSQYTRLKNKTKKRKKKKYKKEPTEIPRSKTFLKLYGKYKYKTPTIANVTIFPISACTFEIPKGFKREVCNYTEQGRKLIHDKLASVTPMIRYLLNQKEYDKSVQYNDCRISLMAAQNGKCGVTKNPLSTNDMHCHHIKPKHLGGTDEYENLKWVGGNVHKLIHATQPETIKKYLGLLNLDAKALKKVNSLRTKAENLEISTAI